MSGAAVLAAGAPARQVRQERRLCPGGALTVVVPEFAMSEESCSYGNFSCQPVLRVSVRGDPLSLDIDLEPSQRPTVIDCLSRLEAIHTDLTAYSDLSA